MSDLLSPADVQNLMLLSALKTDAAMNERIEKMLAAHKAIEETLAQVQQERTAAQAEREEGRRALAEAKRISDETAARGAELAASEKGLGESLTTHNAEKKSFSEIRAQIEADLKARAAALEADEADVARRSKALAEREDTVQAAHHETVDLRDSYRAKHAKLAEIIAADE